jgi:hypothetical protein
MVDVLKLEILVFNWRFFTDDLIDRQLNIYIFNTFIGDSIYNL